MELNNLPSLQSNTTAGIAAAAVPSLKQDVNTQQVTPTKKSSDTGNDVNQHGFYDQDSIIQQASKKKVIAENEIFNVRVTRDGRYFLFTNLINGTVSTVKTQDVVGDNAVNAAV